MIDILLFLVFILGVLFFIKDLTNLKSRVDEIYRTIKTQLEINDKIHIITEDLYSRLEKLEKCSCKENKKGNKNEKSR